jgi:hypothetical protein
MKIASTLLILAFLLVIAFSRAFAGEAECRTFSAQYLETKTISTDVPAHLKGAKIIIILANGQRSEASAELFKVVPRKQQYLLTKVSHNTSCVSESHDKNRISLLGGFGPTGNLSRDTSSGKVDISTKTGAVGGVQYQRKISKDISVGVQGQTNRSGLLSIGLDF